MNQQHTADGLKFKQGLNLWLGLLLGLLLCGAILVLLHPAQAQDSQSSDTSEASELSKPSEAPEASEATQQAPRYPLKLRLSHSAYQSQNLLISRYLRGQLSPLFEVTETGTAQAPKHSRIKDAHQNQALAHLKTTSIGGKPRWVLQLSFQPATEDTSKLPAGNLHWQLDGQGWENLPQLATQLANQLSAVLGEQKPEFTPQLPRPAAQIWAELSQPAKLQAEFEDDMEQVMSRQYALHAELNLRLISHPQELLPMFQAQAVDEQILSLITADAPELSLKSPTNASAYQKLMLESLPWLQKDLFGNMQMLEQGYFQRNFAPLNDKQLELALDEQLLTPDQPSYACYCWGLTQYTRLKANLPTSNQLQQALDANKAHAQVSAQGQTQNPSSLLFLNQQEQQAQLRRQLNRKFDPQLQPHWPELRAQLRLGLLHAHDNAAKDSPFTQALLAVLQDSTDGDDLLLYRTISLSHQGELSEEAQAQARQEVTQFIWQGRELAQNHPAFFPYLLALSADINQNKKPASIDELPAEIDPNTLQPNWLIPALLRWKEQNLPPS